MEEFGDEYCIAKTGKKFIANFDRLYEGVVHEYFDLLIDAIDFMISKTEEERILEINNEIRERNFQGVVYYRITYENNVFWLDFDEK